MGAGEYRFSTGEEPIPGSGSAQFNFRGEAVGSVTPLLQLGGTAVYPSATGASQVQLVRTPEAKLPDVSARLSRETWYFTTTGLGLAGSAVVGHPVVCGVLGLGYGILRWEYVQRHKR